MSEKASSVNSISAVPRIERQQTIEWLQSLELPPLSIAPAQDAEKYPIRDRDGKIKRDKAGNTIPAFTGKNPSYLDDQGIPHLIAHHKYQNRLPNTYELDSWFGNSANGVGTLGGINGIYFIDADIKQFDCSQGAIDKWLEQMLDLSPKLTESFIQKSQSGGYHIAVKFAQKPNFTNWAESEGGKHRGELIGEGRFIVLAPTIGISGKHYVVLTDRAVPVEVQSAELIGIYSTKRRSNTLKPIEANPALHPLATTALDLAQLHSKTTEQIYQGNPNTDDRSAALTAAIRDWFGWKNWANQNGLFLHKSALELAQIAGQNLGIDSDRVDRIIKSINDAANCHPSIHYKGGDKACWLKIRKVARETYEAKCPKFIQDEIGSECESNFNAAKVTKEESSDNQSELPEGEFPQIVIAKLYSETQWIAIDSKLYRWNGKFYEHSFDEIELQRIQSLAESISFYSKKNHRKSFPYANPSKVKAALEWAKIKFAALPEMINPPGLNCKNGILQIEWNGKIPLFKLLPHSPEFRYIYEPLAKYSPDADSADCDQLLRALDKDQQEVFLRLVATAFDIDSVRKYRGRDVRALLCKGIGSNGKDALREAISKIWGRTGITSVALEDFAQYDDGRKFPLASLVASRINWSSENSKSVRLDELQALKRAITGDPLHKERKGKDHEEFKPKAVHLFNVNDIPYLKNSQEAIKSRFAILSFNKVYKRDADPNRGEIEVDPRFKDDPEFIENHILPALLNRLIEAFKVLIEEGIDFSCCDAAMQEVQISQSHLYEFTLESNLVFDPESVIPIGDLWARLEEYYRATQILTIEFVGDRESRNWANPVRPGDPYIKGQNQVAQRFLGLYPQCKKIPLGKNRYGIRGLVFKPVEEPKSLPTEVERYQIQDVIGLANDVAKTGDLETAQQIFSALADLPAELKKKAWAKMSPQTRDALTTAKAELDKTVVRQ